ncbi:MAG TPA: class I SAM-dependent methyltransferase [Vicinamibacterales bacterium]|nr:class I SAM-dependent methyltransferase [Vicinamibacterales bacterium]
MNIPYRSIDDYLPIDVAALRPKGSYGDLIRQRTHAIDGLIAQHGRIPADLLIERRCPTCDANHWRHELAKDHMDLVRCQTCDLVFVNPAFDEAHYQQVYASEAYQKIMQGLGESSHDYRVQRFGAERVTIMARHLPGLPTPRYLDVGCSTGFVVEAARDAGWDATGVDLNPSAVAFGRARGLNLLPLALGDGAFAPASFDAISLFDVLEHLLHPRATLEQAARLLRPGGILFLYVPNYDSASRLLMGAAAHFIWPTHHLNYYTPITMADLMRQVGLSVETVTTEGLDFVDFFWNRRELHGEDTSALEPLADTLQFLANAGAYGKNLRVLARTA